MRNKCRQCNVGFMVPEGTHRVCTNQACGYKTTRSIKINGPRLGWVARDWPLGKDLEIRPDRVCHGEFGEVFGEEDEE